MGRERRRFELRNCGSTIQLFLLVPCVLGNLLKAADEHVISFYRSLNCRCCNHVWRQTDALQKLRPKLFLCLGLSVAILACIRFG